MLRPKKFSPFETKALWGIAFLLIVAGISAALLALQQAQWRLGLASVGILVLAAVYIYAAIRGRPVSAITSQGNRPEIESADPPAHLRTSSRRISPS
jgi:apolipoprotein N-acyltransferase